MRSPILARAWTVVAILAFTTLAGHSEQPPRGARVIRYALTPAIIESANPSDVLAATQLWAGDLGRLVGEWDEAQASLIEGAAAAVLSMSAGTADVLAISTMEYLSVEHTLQAEPSLVYVFRDSAEHEYVLVAGRTITTVRDLAGQRVAVVSGTRQLGLPDVWLDVLALEAGLPPKDQAFQVRQAQKASQAILSVFFHQTDAAVVTRSAFESAVALNPQIGREVVVVAKSPELLPGLVCLRRSLDPGVRRRWVNEGTHLHENPRLRQTLMMLRVTRLAAWDPRYLETARALLQRWDELKHKAGGR